MNQIQQRRSLLKILAGIPLLPLSNQSVFAAYQDKSYISASFTSMPAPSLDNANEMATTSVGSSLEITLSDGSQQIYPLAYEPFFITGDLVSDGNGGKTLAGGYYNIHNQAIIDQSVQGKERQLFSDSPDGTSLLKLPQASVTGVKGNTVFAVVQFEYNTADQSGKPSYGTLPSPIAVLTLDQDPKTGKLSLVKYHNVDTSKSHGLWITCGSSLSPWNTHLSSEEYEPDAQFILENKNFKAFSKNLLGQEGLANPYHYGHMPEVIVKPDGTGTLIKHYSMGRISHELVQVFPDSRTVLMGDDTVNGGLFMFVADHAKNLSSGTLYVAKIGNNFSIKADNPAAKISWVKLGHATSDEIEKMANTLMPADIMTVVKADPNDLSFTKIFYGGQANWVKIKPGMEKAAAFLETHRYAYLMGGSMAFTKMEGTTINIKDKLAYSALSYIQDSMVKNGKGWDLVHGITLDTAVVAGGILEHKLAGGQKDTRGGVIHSEWVPTKTRALLLGEDIAQDALGNTANPEKIANPDNLKFSEKLRTLFIGEDSNSHVNNFLWAYNVDTHKLSRIMSMPSGAEATGLGIIDNLNGFMYITSNFQHAGDWAPKTHDKVKGVLEPLIRQNYKDRFGSAVGYLTTSNGAVKAN